MLFHSQGCHDLPLERTLSASPHRVSKRDTDAVTPDVPRNVSACSRTQRPFIKLFPRRRTERKGTSEAAWLSVVICPT